MHSTVHHKFGSPFSGDFDRVLRTHRFVSPRIMAVIAIIIALLGIGVASYVGQKAVVVTAKAFELRPELFKNPYGDTVAIRESDGRILAALDKGFAERLRQIDDSDRYDVVPVGIDWQRPAKR